MKNRFHVGKSSLSVSLKNAEILLSHGTAIAVRMSGKLYVLDMLNTAQEKHLSTFRKRTDTVRLRPIEWFDQLSLKFPEKH